MQYIAGFTIRQLMKRVRALKERDRLKPIIDFVAEGTTCSQSRILKEYDVLSQHLPGNMYAIKLSPFILSERYVNVSAVQTLIQMLIRRRCTVCIDAEDAHVEKVTKGAVDDLLGKFNNKTVTLYKTYQMYRKDMMDNLMKDIRNDAPIGVKLVRGAYHRKDLKTGLLFENEADTHNAYDTAMHSLLDAMGKQRPEPLDVIFATHNNASLQKLKNMIPIEKRNTVKVAQLIGMNDHASMIMRDSGFDVYKYMPYGSPRLILPYMLRRLQENPGILRHVI